MPLHISVALSQQSVGFPPPPPQLVNPAPHTQALPVHDASATQTTPHAPQLALSVASAASHPVPGRPSQSAKPMLQVKPHAPAVHEFIALAALQTRPHIPQFATAVRVSTSQPFMALPSQLPKPALHD